MTSKEIDVTTNTINSNVDVHKEGVNNMSNNIQIFENNMFGSIRTAVDENNTPMFCLIDVCKALEIKNSRDTLNYLKKDGVGKADTIDTLGRKQETTFINEPNLYRLVMRSNKPQAQQFADWVFEEVIPSIRKHGLYAPTEVVEQLIGDPAFLLKTLQTLVDERKAKEQAIAQKEQALLQLETSNKEKDALQANYNFEVEKHRLVKEKLSTVQQNYAGAVKLSEKNAQQANINYNAWKEEKEKRVSVEEEFHEYETNANAIFTGYTSITDMKDLTSFKEFAGKFGDSNLGRNKIMRFLREKGVLTSGNIPYSQYQSNFKTRDKRAQNNKIYTQTFLTKKGNAFVAGLLAKYGLVSKEQADYVISTLNQQ